MQALAWARSLVGDVTDLVLSRACIGCDALGPPLCARCAHRLDPYPFTCDGLVPGLPPVVAALRYRATARTAVLEHKERGLRWLRRPLGQALAASVADVLDDTRARPVVLVPMPSHRGSARARGRDTLRELGAVAADALGHGALLLPAVERVRDATPQKERGIADRLAGPTGTMRVSPAWAARLTGTRADVVVIDDVVTTGATAREAVRALTAAGIAPRGVAVVAAARDRR